MSNSGQSKYCCDFFLRGGGRSYFCWGYYVGRRRTWGYFSPHGKSLFKKWREMNHDMIVWTLDSHIPNTKFALGFSAVWWNIFLLLFKSGFLSLDTKNLLKNKSSRKDSISLLKTFFKKFFRDSLFGENWGNSMRTEYLWNLWKQHQVVDGTGDRSNVQCCKGQYCIGTWNVRSMNQGKLEVVKQEMTRVNINILISKLRWTGIGEFNSDDDYIYYCGQESLRRNWIALIVNKRVQNAVLGCNLKNDRMISVHFQGKPFNITVIQVYALISNAEEASWTALWRPTRLSRTNTQKRCPFHSRGLECECRKSRNTWSNRQIWPWSTEWSREKTNRALPRGCTGHSKYLLPKPQEKTLHMDITRWSILKSDWLYTIRGASVFHPVALLKLMFL